MVALDRTVVKPFEVKDAREIAEFYRVPHQLMNLFFIVINDVAYPKEAFLLYQGQRKGIQSIVVSKPTQDATGEYTCEARIYPKVDPKVLALILQLPEKERRDYWEYYSKPTVEWGRASPKNVRMSTMQEWLSELAIKRAVCRALRLFSGVGMTSFEELPEVQITEEEARDARQRLPQVSS